MVVDTSALLAVFFTEPHGEWVDGSRLLLAWAGEMPGGFCPGNAVRGQLFDLVP